VEKYKFFAPERVNLQEENVELQLDDGTRIHGWWFASQKKPAKGTFIFFHGNGENLTSHFLTLSWLPAESYNYFIFDYPGYGVSEGKPTPKNTVEAGVKSMKWIHANKDASPLIVFGQSLGGNIAYRATLDVKNDVPIKALILDSTFLSYKSLARKKAAENWITWICQPFVWLFTSDSYAPKALDTRPPIPLLVMVGDKDHIIPSEEGKRLFDESPPPKTFWRIPEGGHGNVFMIEDKIYRKRLLEYLERL
jgi:fermentation-respiration switch protein FrsA (DUF1100 family)